MASKENQGGIKLTDRQEDGLQPYQCVLCNLMSLLTVPSTQLSSLSPSSVDARICHLTSKNQAIWSSEGDCRKNIVGALMRAPSDIWTSGNGRKDSVDVCISCIVNSLLHLPLTSVVLWYLRPSHGSSIWQAGNQLGCFQFFQWCHLFCQFWCLHWFHLIYPQGLPGRFVCRRKANYTRRLPFNFLSSNTV